MKKLLFAKSVLALICIMWILMIIISFTGCYSATKATKQATKAMNVYPAKVLPIFRGQYPCVVVGVTNSYDSTAYLSTMDSVIQLTEFYKALMANIEPTYITLYDTIYLKECANYIKEIDRLKKVIIIKDNYNKDLTEKAKNIAPVINKQREQVEDLSMIKEMSIEKDKITKERDEYKAKNDKKAKWIKWFVFIIIGLLIPYILKAIKFLKP